MSVKNSFDIPRKGARKPSKKPVREKAVQKREPPRARSRKTLREKREEAQARWFAAYLTVFILVVVAVIYGLWRPEVRIREITVVNTPESAAVLAASMLEGKYIGLLPRDSIFLYPEKVVRAALMHEYPELAALSISRSSFTSLELSSIRRTSSFYWCGEGAGDFSTTLASCYEADVEGMVFARAVVVDETATTSPQLRIYAPLDTASSTNAYPLRGRVIGSEHLANLLRFIQAVETLGVPVLSTAIVGDEAELFVTPSTRIKYVLGKEEEAVALAQAALPSMNLLDGTIEYADFRFGGKVYVKRY